MVDWLGPFGPAGVTVPNSDVPAAGFAAAAFLDAVTAKNDALAEGLMTTEGKAKIAHPFASDKDRGYNRGLLRRRLGEFRRGATGYSIRVVSADGTQAGVVGELDGKPFTLKLSQSDRPGVWLVDSFQDW